MIDHTGISVSDPGKSRRFYESALAPLGYTQLREVPVEHTGGRVFFTAGSDVDRYVLWDYVSNRRKIIG